MTGGPTSRPTKILTDISPVSWEHAADRAALQSLRAVPGFDTAVRKILAWIGGEQGIRLIFQANAVRVGPKQFPKIHSMMEDVKKTMDWDKDIEVYVSQTPMANAMAVGFEEPFIVINSGTLSLLSEDIEYRVPIRRHRQAEGPDDDWDVEKELSGDGELPMTISRLSDLQLRVGRLLSGKAHTENPPWFTQRLLTNIDVRLNEKADGFEVESKFLLNRYKAGREQTIVGSRKDTLLRVKDELRISRRRILFNADSYRWGSYVLI